MIHLKCATEAYRKIGISVFILFHFWALTIWVLSPYSSMVLAGPEINHPAGRIEKPIFKTLRAREDGVVSQLIGHYVNLIGAHQYWDFFAPHSARIHRYLSICREIREYPDGARIDCIEPIYRSFDGHPENLIHSHDGYRSRSYRLVENLLGVRRTDLFDALLLYWRRQQIPSDSGTAYLLLHEFTLWPDGIHANRTNKRRDELIWIVPN